MPACRVPGTRGGPWLGRAVLAVSHLRRHLELAITIILDPESVLPGACSATAGPPCVVGLGCLTRGRSTTRSPIHAGTLPTTLWTKSPIIWAVTRTRLFTALSEAERPLSWGPHRRRRTPVAECRPRETYQVGIRRILISRCRRPLCFPRGFETPMSRTGFS